MLPFGEDNAMLRFRGKFTFYHWLAVSLLVHASIVLPFFVSLQRPSQANKPSKLLIELFGMVSNRQVEEKKKGTEGAPQNRMASRQSIARQTKKVIPKQSPGKPKETTPDTPVHVEKADDLQKPTEQETGPTQASTVYAPAVAGRAGGEVEQTGQSIKYADQSAADVVRNYLAKVAKRVHSNVVYPEEARRKGVNGIPTIMFTITQSGAIKEGSLKVRKSSGYPALDANALKSALVSAPFEKPPKELNVSIAVFFDVDTGRPRTTRTSAR